MDSHIKCQVTHITIQCSYKAIRNWTRSTKHAMLQWTIEKSYVSSGHLTKKNDHTPLHHHNTTTTLTQTLQKPSSHSVPMVTLVTMVSLVPTPRGVSSHAKPILCSMDIIPRVGQMDISITLIPPRPTSRLFLTSTISCTYGTEVVVAMSGKTWRLVADEPVEFEK